MGTPDFAVPSLDILIKNNYNVVAVITVPDKPAGRGQQLQQSAVKEYALENNLKILQPEKLKNEDFINELRALKADLQIVVAFRMLPEVVWNMPPMGTFNLHASLLPQYRGAAPINHAIMNGETETGVTTFFLNDKIDCGEILFQTKTPIELNETAGELHDKLMILGADLVLKTVKAIENKNFTKIAQVTQINNLYNAPKIFKENCKINWEQNIDTIYNFIRALSPYPTAFTEIISSKGEKHYLKIFSSEKEILEHSYNIGELISDHKTYLKVSVRNGFVHLKEVQMEGKKRMKIIDFLRGFRFDEGLKFEI